MMRSSDALSRTSAAFSAARSPAESARGRRNRYGVPGIPDAQEVSRVVGRLVAEESDRRVAIWLGVRLGGERMPAVAADYGYRDGSGVDRVVQRLDEKAKRDQALARRLKALAREVSSVKS